MDLGAQEEFGNNFWCSIKLSCSTLHISAYKVFRFRFSCSVRLKSASRKAKIGQNGPKLVIRASDDVLGCLEAL